ncbi:uncharacterized protein LOC116307067 [Actinia tenebrosa]|uniref:Uncharacterized protein LOC116307067 n=1 Tax=Actinia tenebrosa TaxID=6105 RepID=A0A6P8J0S3_ACTTE|nr:uncharacterized protein LOC116307067 [Actinia tenebrosa]
MSHSNPAYERGQDLSISVKSSRHASSQSRLQFDDPELFDGPMLIENESRVNEAAAAQPIKGNMIVAYENVIILRQDTPRDSVANAEAFYENPGTHTPHYHVLENPRDASCRLGSYMAQGTHEDYHHDSLQEDEAQNSYNDTYTNDDEPIYVNPASPVSTAGSTRDIPDPNYYQDEEYNVSFFDDAEERSENWDIYANSEAIRSSYMEDNAINNPGYIPDDEDEHNNPNISTDEPIYDNQIDIDDGHNTSGDPPYALLRDQPNEGVYEDLRGNRSGVTTSDYQSLSPETTRKQPKTKRPKIKPKPARKQ